MNKNKELYDGLLYYCWCVFFRKQDDVLSCKAMNEYQKFLKDADTHFGDCTLQSISCFRCILQELEIQAQKLYDYLELNKYEETDVK